MFGMLFRRAQATLDRTIEGMVNRAIVVVPFLIAGGFGTAALAIRLNRDYGPETGSLILGGAFAALGLVAALAVRARSESLVEGEGPLDTAAAPEPDADAAADAPDLAKADRELLLAALTSAAPIAVPALVRTVGRNLPLLAALAAAAFIIVRGGGHAGGGGVTALEPGE